MVRVLLVDDHPMWLSAVEGVLAGSEFEVVASADTVSKALRVAQATRPELALVDLNLPDGSGDQVAGGLLSLLPEVRVLMLSASAEPSSALRATRAGASGYLLKSASPVELLAACRATLEGRAVFSPQLAGLVLGDLGSSALSEREMEVLRLVARGLTSRQVAERLFLSPRTVENHVNATLKKLHLANRVELTRYALDRGLD